MFDQRGQCLCVECEETEFSPGIVKLIIYCKYWMFNHTGLVVQYR